MKHKTSIVLGKRGRLDNPDNDPIWIPIHMEPKNPQPKRSRYENPLPTRSSRAHNGLLTPEPSTLTEEQLPAQDGGEDTKAIHRKAHSFPMMTLPAELRLRIYQMALVRPYPLSLHVDRVPDPEPILEPVSIPQRPISIMQGLPPRPSRMSRRSSPPPGHESRSDPIRVEILLLNNQIYKEARQILYSENVFTLTLASGIHTLSSLHQRSRSLIKHVVLTIPSHHDILDGFADLVRLGLRYCWGLKSLKIILTASLPDDGRVSGATSVYANAFHILRWLPQGCKVDLDGCVSETVRKVVADEGRLMSDLSDVRSF